MNKNKLLSYINIRSIFVLALLIRLFLSPNNYVDDQRYHFLSDQILTGNFDMDAGSFLCAPFAPYFVAGFKYLFSGNWYPFLFVFQAIISALCVFSLYKIAFFLFENKNVALLSAFIYTIYPDTFLYIRVVGQEVLFQSFLIFSVHFLIQFVYQKQIRDVYLSAIFFSLCFLTKSIVLGWSPFIVGFIFLNKTLPFKGKITASVIYALVCLIFTMPIGFYNLSKHNIYTLSSNGGSHLLWFGNSEAAYVESIEKKKYEQAYPLKAQNDTICQIMRLTPPTSNLNDYFIARKSWGTPKEIQEKFAKASIEWIKNNPKKFWQLRAYNLFRFIFPGAKPPNASFYTLVLILLKAGLLYFCAFMGISKSLKNNFEKHNWIVTLYLYLLLFSVIFGTQIRFRTITIDSFLCIYAAFFLNSSKSSLIQFVKEQILYRIPLFKTNKNTILLVSLEGIGDYILLRNFLPYLKTANRFQGKRIVFIGNYNLKDFVERFDAHLFDEYVWVHFSKIHQMGMLKRCLYLFKTIRKYAAHTVILPTHSRLDIEDLFVHGSGAPYKIASEGDDTRLGFARKKRSDKLFQELIPCFPTSTFQFERNRYFFEQLLGEKIPIQKNAIEGIIAQEPKQIISLYPGASSPFRRWSTQHFADLVLLIHQELPQFSFQILGASWEIQTGLNIIKNLPDNFPIQSFCGQTRLDELVEKIAESCLLISNETSGPHFAAALDVPCVCISNGNHFGRFHPYPSTMAPKMFMAYPSDDFYDEQNFTQLAEKYRRWEDSEKLSNINAILPNYVFDFVKKALEIPSFS